jgi:hypothetical protein
MEDDLERTIGGIWRDILGLDFVEPVANFFDLGGNSLLMIRVHDRIQVVLNRAIPVTQLFQHPTVRSLAQSLSSDQPTARSYQQLLKGTTSNPFRPPASAARDNDFEERARKQLAARRQFRGMGSATSGDS